MPQAPPTNEPRVFAPDKKNVDPRAEKLLASIVISGKLERLDQFSAADLKKGRWTSIFLIACLWTHQTGYQDYGYLNTICGHALRIMMHQKFYGEEITATLRWFMGKTINIKNLIQHA